VNFLYLYVIIKKKNSVRDFVHNPFITIKSANKNKYTENYLNYKLKRQKINF